MAKGGIYDQVGGGFARYSVDAHWLVPHFEKMLYDNALLARAYLHAWQLTGNELFRRVCEETLDWALREMRWPGGRLLLGARRRLRGRGGQVLRLDRGRAARAARRRRPGAARPLGSRPRTELRGPQHPARRRRRDRSGTPLARARRKLYDVRARARVAWPRRQAADGLERAHDRRAGRRGRGARPGRLPRGGPQVRALLARGDARRRRAAAADLQGRARGPERLPRGPRLPRGGAPGALRGHVRDALVQRGAGPGRHDDRALRRTRRAASSTPPTTTRR